MAVGCLALDTGVRAAHIIDAVCPAQIYESVSHDRRDVDSLAGRSDLPGRCGATCRFPGCVVRLAGIRGIFKGMNAQQ